MNYLLFILINFFATFFQGIVGFGFCLIATPLLLLFLSKESVLTATTVIGFALNLLLIKNIKEPINERIFFPLLVSGIIGLPFGAMILKIIPIDMLKVVVGSLSIIFTILLLFVNVKLPQKKRYLFIAGFSSGLLQTATSMSGPSVVLLLAAIDSHKEEIRKILVTYFFWLNLIALPTFLLSDQLSQEGILYGLVSLPFILVAGYLGNKIAGYISGTFYQLIALGVICITGIIAIYSGLQ